MSVPTGYKASQAGVIPEDWDAFSLGKLFTFKNGLNKAKQFFGHGTPIVNYMDVYRFPALRMGLVAGRVDVNKSELDRYSVRRGDVFFTRTSETVDEVGIASAMLDEAEDTVFSGFVLRARPKGDELVDSFKAYAFRSEAVRNQIVAKATYTTRALTNGGALSAIYLAKPPKPEQAAIAEALSDVEEAITAVEAVITKKRALKTATMQALLSGSRRLPGFSGEWTRTPLGKLGRWVGGATPSMSKARFWTNGTIPWASSADVRSGRLASTGCLITAAAVKNSPTREIPENTILLVTRSGILRRFLPVAITTRNLAINQDLKALLVDPAYDPRFLYHAISVVSDAIRGSCLKAGTTVESIDLGWLKLFELIVPNDRDEQAAIAAALFDVDDELLLLDAKLAKLHRLKTGMMQQLLTGKIRLL